MKNLTLLYFVFFLFFSFESLAQDQISGLVNTYRRVVDVDPCESRIDLISALNLNIGDEAILIQMAGAEIDESNDSNFGTVVNYNSAGNYELITINNIIGNSIYLTGALANSYNPNGKLQMVTLEEYSDDVEVVGGVSGDFWSENQRVGGVLAIKCNGTLTFNADAQCNEMGFFGGISFTNNPNNCSWLLPQNDYFYPEDSWRGASKGRGIAERIDGKRAGRGAIANGGGGGNDHNSGGGGGGNMNAGGQGGENNEPSTFGCRGNNPGFGGYALQGIEFSKAFLGGGGGAGHSNNNSSSHGAAGGGIVILIANTIVGNNHIISANGGDAFTVNGDGGGGGGAGGTVIIQAQNIESPLRIEAEGGVGGTVENPADRCFGPGGGGAGGVIYANMDLGAMGVGLSANPGASGLSLNSSECPDGPNGAQAGEAGSIFFNHNIPQGGTLVSNEIEISQQPEDIIICPNDPITYQLEAQGVDVNYQWQVALPNWQDLPGENNATLFIPAVNANNEGELFRCVITNPCGTEVISEEVTFSIIADPTASYTFDQNELMFDFMSVVTNAESVLWDFGDGNTSTELNPSHTFSVHDSYFVQLTASNDCGEDIFHILISTIEGVAPIAQFSSSNASGCAPLSVDYNSLSDNATQWSWVFDGGIPMTSSEENPTVSYTQEGFHSVSLTVTNDVGSDEITETNFVFIAAVPDADFGFSISESTVDFQDNSSNGNSYFWDFGDGNTSASTSPQHTYSSNGTFTVTLTVTNDCGEDSFTEMISINAIIPIANFTSSQTTGCAPLVMEFEDASMPEGTEWNWEFPGGVPSTSTERNPVITYPNPGIFDFSLMVANENGSSSLMETEYIYVAEQPFAGFDFFIDDQTVTFVNTSTNASSFEWDFGDGSAVSNEVSVEHTFEENGLYLVTLVASNGQCAGAISQNIALNLTSTSEQTIEEFILFPNPTQSELIIRNNQIETTLKELKIFAVNGQEVLYKSNHESNQKMSIGHLQSGLYFIQFQTADGIYQMKFIKE